MTNDTDLANHALGLLGETQISNIDDTTSKAARACKMFADAARRETLRLGRWNCATKRAELVVRLPAPANGYTYNLTLPTDFIRLLEVNGEAVKESDEYFEIESGLLLIDRNDVWIRYIADIPIGACDPLLQSAIVARLASKIAIPLSARIEQMQSMEQVFRVRMSEARHIDGMETQGGENAAWEKVLGRSRLGRIRGHRRDPERLEDY